MTVLKTALQNWSFLLTPKTAPKYEPTLPADLSTFLDNSPSPLYHLVSADLLSMLDKTLKDTLGSNLRYFHTTEAFKLSSQYEDKWDDAWNGMAKNAQEYVKHRSTPATEIEKTVLDDLCNKILHLGGDSIFSGGTRNKFPLLTPDLLVSINTEVERGTQAYFMV